MFIIKIFLIPFLLILLSINISNSQSIELREALKSTKALYNIGKLQEAIYSAINAIELSKIDFGRDHFYTATLIENLGIIQYESLMYENAEASFQVLVEAASSTKMANANPNATVWLINGYTPGDAATGILASAKMGATPYPSIPHMGLLHGALSTEMVEFLQGNESAEKALQDVEAAYIAKAKEQGFL